MDPTRKPQSLQPARSSLALAAVLALTADKIHVPDTVSESDNADENYARKSGNGYGRRRCYREWTWTDYACKRKKADKRHARKKAGKLMRKKQKLMAGR